MKKKRLFPIIMASLMSISIMTAFPMGASAVGSDYTDYSPVLITTDDLKTTSFNKYLVMDVNANVPNATFTYTIAPGTAIPADTANGKLAVLAGINTPVFKTSDTTTSETGEAKFTTGDTTYAEADANTKNDTVKFTTTNNTTDEKYAKKTLTIDFDGVQFTEPGVYRYIITESGTNQGVTNDTVTERTLDVYVKDATSGTDKKLEIEGYVMYSGKINTAPSATASNVEGKSSSYTNTYATHDLTFGKEVTGNQGSKDKYFKFTVTISDAVEGTKYDVDISKADATLPDVSALNSATDINYAGQTNTETITVGDGGTVTTNFYLQDGQYITIKGLADKTKYEITEVAEDYTSTKGIEQKNSTFKTSDDSNYIELKGAVSNTESGITEDIFTGYTNDRTGTIPTGIILSIAPTVIIGLALIGGIVFLIIRNKKRKYEE